MLTTPRAKLTVLTWLSSIRAFDSILAPASELEKRGGRDGRARGLWLKKSGEGGWRSGWKCVAPREKPSRKCLGLGLNSRLSRLAGGSKVEVGARSSKGLTTDRFLLLDVGFRESVAGGVCGPAALALTLTLLALDLPLPLFSMGGHVARSAIGVPTLPPAYPAPAVTPPVVTNVFSGKDIASGTASAAAWMRFFSM